MKGTTIGTTTDATGHYFLKNLPVGTLTIEVKYIGYLTLHKEITVQKNSTQEVNFELEADNIALDEVVVSANRTATMRWVAPSLVNVMDTKLFESTHATCLAQGLSFQRVSGVEDNARTVASPGAYQWIGWALFCRY